MKKLSILFFVLILVSFQMTAQSSKTYNLDSFKAISISNSADVIYSQGTQSVSVSGPQELIDKLDINVKNGTLNIASKKGKSGNWYGKEGVKVKVSAPNIKALAISGSGDFFSESNIDMERFSIAISGSGDVTWKGNINCEEFKLAISGSGDVELKGSAERVSIACSGSGDVEMENFKAEEVKVANSGSADVEIYASKKLSVVNSGSGDVEVKGSPEKKSIVNTGSGDIDYK